MCIAPIQCLYFGTWEQYALLISLTDYSWSQIWVSRVQVSNFNAESQQLLSQAFNQSINQSINQI